MSAEIISLRGGRNSARRSPVRIRVFEGGLGEPALEVPTGIALQPYRYEYFQTPAEARQRAQALSRSTMWRVDDHLGESA